MSRESNGPRPTRSLLAAALSAALVLASCPLQGVAYALEAGDDVVTSDEAAEASAEAGDDFTDIADAAVLGESGKDADVSGDDEESEVAESADDEEFEASESAEATEDPIAQVEALGIPTDPEGVEGYDPAADQEPEQDEDAPTGYDSSAGADDEGIALQSRIESVRIGDWSYYVAYASLVEGENPYYTVDGYYGSDSSITLPSTLDGKPITRVDFSSNRLPSTVTSVTIPACITTIVSYAFAYSKVTNVTFEPGSQLKEIWSYAFNNTPITEFTLPEGVTKVGNSAFSNTLLKRFTLSVNLGPVEWGGEYCNPCAACPGLEFVVPSGCKNYRVENGALLSKDGTILYAQQSDLKGGTYAIPSGVRVLAREAMCANTTFSGIELPQGLTTLGTYCLEGTSITNLIIPDSVTIANWEFCGYCTSLTSVRIGNGVEELDSNCFFGCSSLTSVTLGSKLRVIGNACFASTKLSSVYLPPSVEQINYGAFGDISALKEVTGGTGLRYIYGLAFRNAGITSFPFGENLKFVSNTAFYNCKFTPSYPSYMDEQSDGYYSYDGTLVVRGDESYSMAWQVLDLVNQERAKQGLSALTMDKDLLAAAMQRAAETSICFDHTRPTGQNCFSACTKMTRENIASGQSTAQSVMDSWMNSSGHKANILSSGTKSIGIGCVKVTGRYFWVQCFGTAAATTVSKPADVSNKLMKVNYLSKGLESFQSRFEVYPVSADGSGIVSIAEGLKRGESQRYALFTFPWGANGRQVTMIDDSCITWSLSGSGAKLNGSTVTGVSDGTFTLTASVGNGTISASTTRSIAKDISGAKVEAASQTYTGANLYPEPKVTFNGTVLDDWTDYSVLYKNNVNAGTATIVVTGRGKYEGTATGTFTIKPADASKATVESNYIYDPTYTGTAMTPSATVRFNGRYMHEGTDYTLSYKNNVNAGTATIVATFKGNYSGTATGTFTISPINVTWAPVSIPNQTWTGKALTPAPIVSYNGKMLTKGVDYDVSYSNNVNVGTATATIKFKGNYTGTTKGTFKIAKVAVSRLSGNTRYDTMASVVEAGFSSAKAVVIASGENFPDALGASSLAGSLGAPVVLTSKGALSDRAREEVHRLGAEKVYIVGGTAAVSSEVESELAPMLKGGVIRVSGSTRQQTAIAVAGRTAALTNPDTVIVASGSSFPDALSVSPYAYAKGYPIYLTEGDGSLSKATLSAVRSLGTVKKVVIVGGESAVSPPAESALKAAGYSVERWSGATRYETSLAIAGKAVADGMSWSMVAVASGENFPDALAGASLVGKSGGVLLLTPKSDASAVAGALRANRSLVRECRVLGGSAAVSAPAMSQIEAALR